VNSKEENSYDFCPNYVQEFGLYTNKCRQILTYNTVLNCDGVGGYLEAILGDSLNKNY
jgi:hypothetical protein